MGKSITWTNEKRKLRDLKPWPRNPRVIKSKQAERLVESVNDFGQVETLAIGPNDGELYNGHQRLSVLAGAYGLDYEVDVRVASRPLSEKERERLTVYLHRGTTGDFDFDILANEFEVDDLLSWGFDAFELGIEEPEADAGSDTEPQIDKAEELRAKWDVSLGQLWQLGDHRLICGDCTDAATVARLMGGEKADALLTDPPYGIGVDRSMHEKGGQQYGNAAASKRHYADTNWDNSTPTKSVIDYLVSLATEVILWGGNYFELSPTRCYLVWDKQNDGNQFADCELAWTNLDKPVRLIRHMWNGMIRKGGEDRLSHPTQKPLDVIVWCIEQFERNPKIILDTYLGSGTTLIACENLGRKCRAVELSPAYVAVALQRFADHTGIEPVLVK